MAGNPFTSAQAPAYNLIAPDIGAQQAQLARQQQMADLLRSQAMAPDQGTQVVNGWAVKKSPIEGISKVAQALMGGYMQHSADDKQLALAKAMQERMSGAFDSMAGGDAGRGLGVQTPPQTANVMPTGPDGAPMPGAGVPAPAIPATQQMAPASPQMDQITKIRNQAKAAYMMGNTDLANKLLENISTMTNEQRNMAAMGQDPQLMGQLGTAAARKAGIIELQPGTTALDLSNGQERFQPKVGEGISLNNGVASAIPGYAGANADIAGASAGAVSAAQAGNKMVTVNIGGRPVMMTEQQAVQMSGGAAPNGAGTHYSSPDPTGMSLNFKSDPQATFDQISKIKDPALRSEAMQAFGKVQEPAQGGVGIAGSTPAEDAARLSGVTFNTGLMKSAHESNAATLSKLQDTVRSEFELQNRNAQLLPMLEKIQTGGFNAEGRIGLANAIQTSGLVPDSMKGTVSQWLAAGDPTTGKVLENQLAAAGIKTMLDTLDKEGKPNRAIFDAIHNAQESVKSGNGTLKQVFALQNQLYQMHYEQEQEMAHAIAAPDYNPLTMQADFSKRRNESLKKMQPVVAPAAKKSTTGFTYLGKE